MDLVKRLGQIKGLFIDEAHEALEHIAALLDRGEVQAALTELQPLLTQYPHHARALCLAGFCHLAQWSSPEDEERAQHYFNAALRQQPALPEALFGMGEVCRKKQRWAESLAHYKLAIEKTDREDILHAALLAAGKIHLEHLRPLDPALHCLRRAFQLRPEDTETRATLALACHMAARARFVPVLPPPIPVELFLRQAADQGHLSLAGHVALDQCLSKRKAFAERARLIEMMASRFPDHPLVLLRKALLARMERRWSGQESHALRAIQSCLLQETRPLPGPALHQLGQAHLLLAEAQHKRQQPEAALQTYQQLWGLAKESRDKKWLARVFRRAMHLVYKYQLFDTGFFLLDPRLPASVLARSTRSPSHTFRGDEQTIFSALAPDITSEQSNLVLRSVAEQNAHPSLYSLLTQAYMSHREGRRFQALAVLHEAQHTFPRSVLPALWVRSWSPVKQIISLEIVNPPMLKPGSFERVLFSLDAMAKEDPRLSSLGRATQESYTRLRRPLQVAVVGEFNAGKSSLINALLEEDVLPTGILPTTAFATVVQFAKTPSQTWIYRDGSRRTLDENESPLDLVDPQRPPHVLEIGHPHPLLQSMTLIDTPGLNALDADHTARATEVLDRADVFLWVFAAGQAGKQTEIAWLDRIKQQGNPPVLCILNKVDAFHVHPASPTTGAVDPALFGHLTSLLNSVGINTPLLPVSTRTVRQMQETNDQAALPGEWTHLLNTIERDLISKSKPIQMRRAAFFLAEALHIRKAECIHADRPPLHHDWPASYHAARNEATSTVTKTLAQEKERLLGSIQTLYRSVAQEILHLIESKSSPRLPHLSPLDRDYLVGRILSHFRHLLLESLRVTNEPTGKSLLPSVVGLASGHWQSGVLEQFFSSSLRSLPREESHLARGIEFISPWSLDYLERAWLHPLEKMCQDRAQKNLDQQWAPLLQAQYAAFEQLHSVQRPLEAAIEILASFSTS